MARLAYAFFGYLAAVVIAVAVAVFAMLPWTAGWNVASWGRHLEGMYRYGIMVTLPAALPGFLLMLFVSHRVRWTGWLPYAGAGTLNAALAWAICDIAAQIFERGSLHVPLVGMPLMLLLSCLLGGFAGGVAYWAVVRSSFRGKAASS